MPTNKAAWTCERRSRLRTLDIYRGLIYVISYYEQAFGFQLREIGLDRCQVERDPEPAENADFHMPEGRHWRVGKRIYKDVRRLPDVCLQCVGIEMKNQNLEGVVEAEAWDCDKTGVINSKASHSWKVRKVELRGEIPGNTQVRDGQACGLQQLDRRTSAVMCNVDIDQLSEIEWGSGGHQESVEVLCAVQHQSFDLGTSCGWVCGERRRGENNIFKGH
ncbi:hypothetical protein DFH09DRAFT_1175625 [Mycena vulgaris]|nr:hypothetical protein DFH09DRAFT_1175625 [Mycena vulgaris]